jgi:1,4-dihydroxy-6-naphthoate synthase
LHGLVDNGGYSYQTRYDDIATLNDIALGREFDLVKVSVAMLPRLAGAYYLLRSGGAMGYGNGPILVARGLDVVLSGGRVAIPGATTTASMLLHRLLPAACTNLVEMPFNEVAGAVLRGDVDAGVLIHEGRFTFAEQGLVQLADLGEMWHQQHHAPIPLGAIVVKRDLGLHTALILERSISESVKYALKNPSMSEEFVKSHAQELSPEVLHKHISYFVNDFSVNFSQAGVWAIDTLLGAPVASEMVINDILQCHE